MEAAEEARPDKRPWPLEYLNRQDGPVLVAVVGRQGKARIGSWVRAWMMTALILGVAAVVVAAVQAGAS